MKVKDLASRKKNNDKVEEYIMSNYAFQDSFLDKMQQDKMSVSVYLNSGIKLQGFITGYDHQVIFLKNSSVQMIFKHAISTIIPARDYGKSAYE